MKTHFLSFINKKKKSQVGPLICQSQKKEAIGKHGELD